MNLVLISIDTCRADHLGCYGYPKKTSPNVDALATCAEPPAGRPSIGR